jgi:signal transduction histidine kinase
MSSAPSEPTRPRRRRTSLAFRINAWYVIAFIASLAALVAFAVPTVRNAMQREDASLVATRLERHVTVLTANGLPAYRNAVEGAASLGERDTPVRVRDSSGNTVYQHGNVEVSVQTVERNAGELRVELGESDEPWSALASRLRPGALLLAGVAILLALVGGLVLTRRGLRPVRELADTARGISQSGDLSRRVAERGSSDELDDLSVAFNRMLARNERLVHGMRDALDNVAHDLRTPLTRLRGSAEIALRDPDPGATREALADCIEETDRVLVILRAAMDVSEAETGIMKLERAPVPLGRLAADTVDLYSGVAEEAGVALSIAGDDGVVAEVDAARMRQAIGNLVDNAIKYTPQGGRVELAIARAGADATVQVRDTGMGIGPETLPRIWDRLYRGDASRSKPGLGLGLSLVKAIVEAHGGAVSVDSTVGAGSTFTIRIPGGSS